MTIYILMKNGWPVSVFDERDWAQENIKMACRHEPNNHWMLLEFFIRERQ